MQIKAIGGEFALIDRLTQIVATNHADLIQGIGDDAAVLRIAPEPSPYLLVTTDLLVEERHYRRRWAKPAQIGFKAAECNVSDIAAMGGTPTFMFVSLVLTPETEVAWAEELYRGLESSCRQHGITVAGGDTVQGAVGAISITLLGSVAPEHLRLRSHARPGDQLMVTGSLGASAAALALLLHEHTPSDYLLEKHLTPRCRLDAALRLAPLAHAMIDISDGLGAEVQHICTQSQVGAVIDAAAIPLHPEVRAAGERLSMDPLQFALSGGEDYELLFSIAPEKLNLLSQIGLTCHAVGRITTPEHGPMLRYPDGRQLPLPGGFNHFS